METIKLAYAPFLMAIHAVTTGTKITNRVLFDSWMQKAVATFASPTTEHNWKNRLDVAGGNFLKISARGSFYVYFGEDIARQVVLSGYGLRSQNPADYVIRPLGFGVAHYLKRELAVAPKSLLVEVMTREEFATRQDMAFDFREKEWVDEEETALGDATHVITAVHGSPNDLIELSRGNYESLVRMAELEVHRPNRCLTGEHNLYEEVSD